MVLDSALHIDKKGLGSWHVPGHRGHRSPVTKENEADLSESQSMNIYTAV